MADVSVVVCTHNRAGSLDRLLESCCRLRVPAELDWELIVVANACDDDTPQVIETFQSRLPLRVVELTGIPVLSRARNAGSRASRGKLVIFTDDDVEVAPGWLSAYAEGSRAYPDAVFFGGPIIPRYDRGRPAWLAEELEYGTLSGLCVSRRMRGQPGPYSLSGELPFGANFSVRRMTLLERPFRTDFGPTGRQRLCHEETDLMRALMNKGHIGIYLPEALVWHHTDAARLRLASILRQGYGSGRSDVLSGMVERPEAASWTYWLPNRHIRKLYLETVLSLFPGRFLERTRFYKNAWCLARGWGQVRQWIVTR